MSRKKRREEKTGRREREGTQRGKRKNEWRVPRNMENGRRRNDEVREEEKRTGAGEKNRV